MAARINFEIVTPERRVLAEEVDSLIMPGADGYLVITAQVTEAWIRLARLIGGETLAADERFHSQEGRNRNREEILELVGNWTRARRVADCLQALDQARVPCAKVQTIDEVIADPQIRARNMMVEQEHPVLGKIQMPNLPFHFSGCDTTITQIAPFLGQQETVARHERLRRTRQREAPARHPALQAGTAA